ncbi:MAG: retroviral-like aspartic protease family protein [Litorivicinus sp.]
MKFLMPLLLCLPAWAAPQWSGQFNGQALIDLRGQLLKLAPGESQSDVELIRVWPQGAQVRWRGQLLQLPQRPAITQITTDNTLVAGRIRQVDVNWRIDTGASDVVISQQLAMRLGLKLQPLERVFVHAQGHSRAWQTQPIPLDLGPWRLPPRSLVVLPGRFPDHPLFGLSGLLDFTLTLRQGQLTLAPIAGNGIMPASNSADMTSE